MDTRECERHLQEQLSLTTEHAKKQHKQYKRNMQADASADQPRATVTERNHLEWQVLTNPNACRSG